MTGLIVRVTCVSIGTVVVRTAVMTGLIVRVTCVSIGTVVV